MYVRYHWPVSPDGDDWVPAEGGELLVVRLAEGATLDVGHAGRRVHGDLAYLWTADEEEGKV